MRAGASMSRLVSSILVASALAACASAPRPDWTPVPIGDIASVSGKWSGTLMRQPPDRRDDWLELTIAPDGSFEARSVRLIGTMAGKGRFTLADGKLIAKNPTFSITGTLLAAENRRMLRLDATSSEGIVFRSNATPAGR